MGGLFSNIFLFFVEVQSWKSEFGGRCTLKEVYIGLYSWFTDYEI